MTKNAGGRCSLEPSCRCIAVRVHFDRSWRAVVALLDFPFCTLFKAYCRTAVDILRWCCWLIRYSRLSIVLGSCGLVGLSASLNVGCAYVFLYFSVASMISNFCTRAEKYGINAIQFLVCPLSVRPVSQVCLSFAGGPM